MEKDEEGGYLEEEEVCVVALQIGRAPTLHPQPLLHTL